MKFDFDDTALIPEMVLSLVMEEREREAEQGSRNRDNLDSVQFAWFAEYVDAMLRYQFATNSVMRKGLLGKSGPRDGRIFAEGFVYHWLDAVAKSGFRTFQERHPIESLTIGV